MKSTVSKNLKDTYDKQYNNTPKDWRLIGGKKKAENIIKLAKNISFKNVLDVGSGDGSVLYWLDQFQFCNYIVASEISESGIKALKEKQILSVKEIKSFDGYILPFADKQFDLVTCSHVIEHVEHPRLLLREIKRVSKYQIFEVPIDFSLSVDKKVKHFLSYGHINIYTPQTFRFLLQTENLKIENFENAMYSKDTFNYLLKDTSFFSKYKLKLKNFIWNTSGFLKKIKPNTTTVLTSATDEDIKIM